MKKAVLVGVRYTKFDKTYRQQVKELGPDVQPPLGPFAVLPTPHKDCDTMTNLLVDVFGFERENITVLKDDGRSTDPTRENIITALKDLINNATHGDHLVFHFSGHGSQAENNDGGEADNYDEIILPSDVRYNPEEQACSVKELENCIVDDELNDILAKRLPDGVRLTVVLDCCHSGTGMDLPYDNLDLDFVISPVAEIGNASFSLMSSSAKGHGESISTVQERRPKKVATLNPKLPFAGQVEISTDEDKLDTENAGMHELEVRSFKVDHAGLYEARDTTQYITFWAACIDNEVTIEDTSGGGILTMAMDSVLRKKKERTHRELWVEIRRNFEGVATKANEYDLKQGSHQLKPYPVIGSNVPLQQIAKEIFSF